ncbi:MAG TPA: serine/threonine-protein kinase [Herpetosiphonaceae bacterium]
MRLNDLIDRQLGPYRIEALIGRGGMAAVYRALDTRLQRHVALKMLYPQYLADTDIVERFRREAITAAQLDHPHIAPIFDVGEDDGIVYLAMKLLPGPSLADVLQREPRLPAERVVTLAQQIALALDEAHQHGIIHRDIKPGNVLFDSRGNAILTDFGIAKSLDAPSLTESSVIVGTPDYIAPEQINPRLAPNGKLDHRADLYSLGALVYRMLTGRRPFDGSAQTVLLAHLQDQPIPPSEVVPQLSAGVDAVIAKVMAKRPEERYDTASEFVQALSESFSDQTEVGVVFPPASIRRDAHTRQTTQALKASIVPAPASATRPTTPPAAEQLSESPSARSRWRSRRMLMIMAIGLLLVVGTGGVLARFMNQSADAAGVALLATTQTAQAASAPPTATPTRTAAPTRTATAKPTATTQPSATTQPTATSTTAPTETTTAPIVVAQATPRPTARPASRPTARPASRPTARPASRPTARPTPQPTPPPAPQPTATPALPRCQAVLTGGFGNLWRTNAEVRAAIGCPIEEELPGYSVEQIFQGGQMYYREAGDQFWIFDGGVSGTWRRRLDVYPSDPEPTDPAPDGLLTPSSGFGRLWQKDPAIRQALGWATTPEVGFTGVIQRFDNGFMLYSPAVNGHGKRIYVLYSNGTFVIYKDTYTGP